MFTQHKTIFAVLFFAALLLLTAAVIMQVCEHSAFQYAYAYAVIAGALATAHFAWFNEYIRD